jgi:hypothetical protein
MGDKEKAGISRISRRGQRDRVAIGGNVYRRACIGHHAPRRCSDITLQPPPKRSSGREQATAVDLPGQAG